MALTPKKQEGQLTTVNKTTIYTCPAVTKARVFKLTLTNIDTAVEQQLDGCWLVPSGGTADNTNIIELERDIDPSDGDGGTVALDSVQGHVLDAGDFIQLEAAVANKLTWHLTVMESA